MTQNTVTLEVGNIWLLESGFGPNSPVNNERDEWFNDPLHKVFVVKMNIGHCLCFTALADGTRWMTTPAKLVEGHPSTGYCCYQTQSGTRYHLTKATIQFK
jgi:hypothetical protein